MPTSKEYGRIGQRRWDGVFSEEFLPELTGQRGIKVYKEMASNDDTVGAILFAIKMLIRKVTWNVEPGGSSPKDREAAEFVLECLDDMQSTWTDTISEILSFLTYGWSFHEIVYKRRNGRKKDRAVSSRYEDGLIGWAKLAPRAQDTLYKWEYDNRDNLIGMTQQPPPDYSLLTIPMRKALLFRTESAKDNPEGRSILRNAYRCFDAATEILTKNGWKYGCSLSCDDEVATLNPGTGKLEYERPKEIHRYHHDGEMIHFRSKFLDILVTDNHRMWVRKDKARTFGFVEAADVKKCHQFMRYADWDGIDKEWYHIPEYVTCYIKHGKEQRRYNHPAVNVRMDDWLAFLALFLSEGCTWSNGKRKVVTITQHDCRRGKIKSILDRLPWHYYEHKGREGITHYEFCNAQLYEELAPLGKDIEKYVPDYVKELPKNRITVFLDWYSFGDGGLTGNVKDGYDGTYVIGTISSRLADDIQELGLKAGYECQISMDLERKSSFGKNLFYKISLGKRRYHKAKHIEHTQYSGEVWCPTTENGIVYVRRKGKPAWVGNCWYFKRRIQEIEAIGIERDLAGLPVITVPEGINIWDPDDEEARKIYAALVSMVKNIRRNEFEGLVLPNGYVPQLLSTGGTRQFDTNAIITRYDAKIAQTVLADFIMLGHEGTGSYSLSADKTQMFCVAIGAYLDIICETINSQGIPSLIDINGDHFSGITDYPFLTHGDVQDRDITQLSTFLKDMIGTGLIIPDEPLEEYVRSIANLPEMTNIPDGREKDQRREEQRQRPEYEAQRGSAEEDVPDEDLDGDDDDDIDEAEVQEARKRLGR